VVRARDERDASLEASKPSGRGGHLPAVTSGAGRLG
jgi:hypothetical protein